jgi:glutaredoxin
MRPNQPNAVFHLFFALLIASAFSNAHAVYKYIDANGQVTYSDRPPPAGAKSLAADTSGAGVAIADLPYAVKASATRYPVTLYSLSSACTACNDARKFLTERGIPFTERTIRGAADISALKKLNLPAEQFPVISIGTQVQTNFEAGALGALLDAAGYPKTSALPQGYKHAPAQAMTSSGSATESIDAKDAPQGAAKSAAGAKPSNARNANSNKTQGSAASTSTIRF